MHPCATKHEYVLCVQCREPEETKEQEEAEFGAGAEAFGALPAPMGANETWGDAPAAPAVTPGFEAAGFETAGVLMFTWFE